MSTVCFFHTGAVVADTFSELAAEHIPEADHYHQVDESVINELLEVGELTPAITRRICAQLQLAEEAGADVVLDTCSSTSPAVDVARELVEIPIIKVDDPMTERAVELGDRIGVVVTASSTRTPSTELIATKAEAADRSIEIDDILIDEAFDALMSGDSDRHDELVVERAVELATGVDVLVLAQASMSHLEPTIAERVSVPVLSSPDLAMEAVAETIGR